MFARARITGWLTAAALLVMAGAGCTRKTAVQSANEAGVLLYASSSEPSDLDPHTNINGDTNAIFSAAFEGLVTLKNDGATIAPGVAERWEVSPDQLTYTFHLRPEARWSNGEPVTAGDFLFSFRRIFDPVLAAESSSFGYMIAGAEAYNNGQTKDPADLGLRAPDPHTFVIQLGHPCEYFLAVLAAGSPFYPVYRPALEQADDVHRRGGQWTRAGRLISNGAFKLTEWKQDQVITLSRNPFYWDKGNIKLTAIRFFPVEDEDAQERGFRAGQFHVTTKFPPHREQGYVGMRPSPLVVTPEVVTQFVTFNVAKFPDVRVRRALALAIDRESIVKAVFGRFAAPAHSLVPPGLGNYYPPASSACRFDPEQARALLAAAGFPGGRGFPPVDLMLVGNAQQTVRFGEGIQQAWKQALGIETHLAPTEMKVYLDAERTKHYTAIIEQWGAPWNDPTATLQTAESNNPNNDSGWTDPAFDAAFRRADSAQSGAARVRDFDLQEALIAENVPYAPLFFPNVGRLISPSVQGWRTNRLGIIDWKGVAVAP